MLTMTALFDSFADFSTASCTILSWSSFVLLQPWNQEHKVYWETEPYLYSLEEN